MQDECMPVRKAGCRTQKSHPTGMAQRHYYLQHLLWQWAPSIGTQMWYKLAMHLHFSYNLLASCNNGTAYVVNKGASSQFLLMAWWWCVSSSQQVHYIYGVCGRWLGLIACFIKANRRPGKSVGSGWACTSNDQLYFSMTWERCHCLIYLAETSSNQLHTSWPLLGKPPHITHEIMDL
jgi:hypothetical protein